MQHLGHIVSNNTSENTTQTESNNSLDTYDPITIESRTSPSIRRKKAIISVVVLLFVCVCIFFTRDTLAKQIPFLGFLSTKQVNVDETSIPSSKFTYDSSEIEATGESKLFEEPTKDTQITGSKQQKSPTPTPTAKLQSTSTPTATNTQTPTPTPTTTPTPTSTPPPPVMNIGYPGENMTISINENDSLCIVDEPVSNTQGLQRKFKFNSSGWTNYETISALCVKPINGSNTIQLQYKNSSGSESQVYTRTFTAQLINNVSITFTGEIYRDENCNGVKDGTEQLISVPATITMFRMPEWSIYGSTTSNSSGSFTYTGVIPSSEMVTLKPSITSPSGYTSNPHYSEPTSVFGLTMRSANVSIPQVPYEFFEACQ